MTSAALPRSSREAPVEGFRRRGLWGGLECLAAAVLRVPLLGKILGANLLLVAGGVVAHYSFPPTPMAAQLGLLAVLSFTITGSLVWLALRPVATLQDTAARVSQGDFGARAGESRIADAQMLQLIRTMNRLLDRVQADRARIHYLAGRGVRAREIERETVARELRDSFAQTLSGIAMQLAAVQRASAAAGVVEPIERAREMIQELTEEMRSVAETLYPGTLSEFGLLNAIEALARRVSRRSQVTVEVEAGLFLTPVSPRAANALYRVAEEALRNIEQHSQARRAVVRLTSNGHVTMEVEDDGRGIDMKASDPLQAGLGLFSARAVLALSGGELQISSGPGLGTQVIARMPAGTTTTPTHTGSDHGE